MQISYDFHIHTCLSPCGDNDMTPANITGMAALKTLDAIAITDHNTCRNCAPAIKLGQEYGLLVVPGMELTTSEEVHVLCLFEELSAALEFGDYVYEHLLPVENKPAIFGEQLIVDETENVTGTLSKLLINATDISFDNVFSLLLSYRGIMIPAHINKDTNSLIANLGFVPPDSSFKCYEYVKNDQMSHIIDENPGLKSCVSITDSDAHYLEHISEPVNFLDVEQKSVRGILTALTGGMPSVHALRAPRL